MSENLNKRIRQSRLLLQNQYAYLGGDGTYEAAGSGADSQRAFRYLLQNPWAHVDGEGRIDFGSSSHVTRIEVGGLLGGKSQGDPFARHEIESIVRKLQLQLWIKRSDIWPEADMTDPINALDPGAALESIGYSVHEDAALGMHVGSDGSFEVAGLFDRASSTVRISNQLPYQTRSFTLAHELGHAVLHSDMRMHRDRALDGSMIRPRNSKEYEADVFAALFLLPAKQVRLAMRNRLLTESFRLNEATAFALNVGSVAQLKARCRDLRALSRIISAATSYNGKYFKSLAEHFGVSTETMAIRLEELKLLQQP